MKLLVKNGTLVSGSGARKGDVLIEDERIAAVAASVDDPSAKVIDAGGCLVYPGFIDAHTHLDMMCAAGRTADRFDSGTRAALAGGTTTVVDFATQDKGGTLSDGLAEWHKLADGIARCDYGFHMAVTDWTGDMPEQMAEMCRAGIPSFKVYLAYDNLRLNDIQVEKLLGAAASLGAVVGAHCEDGDMVNEGVAREKALGNMGCAAHPRSRPNRVESESVKKFLAMARGAGAEAYVVHLSTREGLGEIRAARRGGQKVWTETCAQYLALTEEVYDRPDGAKFVCAPPIRSAADRDALIAALAGGEIDVLASDHCSFTLAQKALGRDDFSLIPNGLPGVEHRAALAHTAAACASAQRLCAVLSENPARIFGMYPRKGCIAPGSDADLVIWDPRAVKIINAAHQYQNTDYTPFEGMAVTGAPRLVLLRGAVAAENGRVNDSLRGRFIPGRR